MIIKFIKAFTKATHKERFEFFQIILHEIKEKFINYWFGYVDVHKQLIHCIDKIPRLNTFSIVVGKHGEGQWFSELDAIGLPKLIDNIKTNTCKHFRLHINLGCGAYQDYIFNKYQIKLLLNQLEKLLKSYEIYQEDIDYENNIK